MLPERVERYGPFLDRLVAEGARREAESFWSLPHITQVGTRYVEVPRSNRALFLGQEALCGTYDEALFEMDSHGARRLGNRQILEKTDRYWADVFTRVKSVFSGHPVADFQESRKFWAIIYFLAYRIQNGAFPTTPLVLGNNTDPKILDAIAWGQLLKADLDAKPPSSVAAWFAQSGNHAIVRAEIASLDPGAVFFLTGPSYDSILEDAGFTLGPGHFVRRVTGSGLPNRAFRLFHPAARGRSAVSYQSLRDALEGEL